MPLDLQAIKERLTNATPGPWEVGYGEFDSGTSVYIEGSEVSSKFWRVDAEFIANARQDFPALITEVERLQAMADFEVKCTINANQENAQLCEALKAIETRCYGEGHYIEIAEIARKALDGDKQMRTPEQNALIDKVIANLQALDGDK